MIRRQDITTQADGVTPRAGVYVTVKLAGAMATIYDADGGAAITTSTLLSGVDGSFTYWVAAEGTYTEEFRLSLLDQPRTVQAVEIGADLNLRTDLAAAGGAALSGFIQSGTGAVARTAQEKLRDVVSVKDFGALGNGVADDTAAIQAAFNSGAKKVVFPAGTYLCSAGLTVPNWLHICGEGYQPTIGVGTGAVVLRFTQTSGVALTLGFNPLIENLVIWNSGGSYNDTTKTLTGTTAVAVDLAADNATLEKVSFHLWDTAIRFGPSAFYCNTDLVEFNRCTNGYRANGVSPYNVNISRPISRDTTNFFVGQVAFPARNVKVIGGSIEGYSSVASGVLDFSAFGTYFETIAQRAGAYAIEPGVNGASVALFGCVVYMDYTARFVNLSAATGCSLTSHGNVFDGVAPSGAIFLYTPSTGTVSLGGDKFGAAHPNNALYLDSVANGFKLTGITMPVLPAANAQAAYSGRTLIGAQGLVGLGLATAPAGPVTGLIVMADGVAWDPLARGGGRPYFVIWQGDRWRGVDGEGAKATGWATATGTATRTAFDTATVTLPQIAERMKALIDDLTAQGAIGA